jgi:hypothetical protein
MSNYGAPVCNVTPPAAPVVTPTVPPAAIPVATDLQSALAAVNRIRQWIQQTTNQTPNTVFSGVASKDPSKKKPQQVSGFTEVPAARTYKTVKVTNPKDKSQYVVVRQITGLKFHNPATNQSLNWAQGIDPNGQNASILPEQQAAPINYG